MEWSKTKFFEYQTIHTCFMFDPQEKCSSDVCENHGACTLFILLIVYVTYKKTTNYFKTRP